MRAVHRAARSDGRNHLIFCSHPPVFTVGAGERREWDIETLQSDRGGSITCHAPGQLIIYFCFQVPRPVHFYRKVRRAFDTFFAGMELPARYDRKQPGWYLERNRKIASLGFRYRHGVSLHGVSLNIDPDLAFCNRIPPCNLPEVQVTSLRAEGCDIQAEEAEAKLLDSLCPLFEERVAVS